MSNVLQERATLVSITIRCWGNRLLDKKATEQVDAMNHAQHAGKYIKHLVPPETMKPIVKAISSLRTNHYLYTLSWGDNGERLLPGKLVFEFSSKHKSLKQQFDDAVEEFLLKYPAHKAAAPARLGSLYDPTDYPSVDKLRKRFGVELNWSLISDAKDFRVDVAEATAKQIRTDIEESIHRRQKEALRHCHDRMLEVVQNIHDRLSVEDAIFRDSLIENARVTTKLMKDLNFLDDPEIETMRKEVEALLVPPQRLRDDKALRADKAEQARKLLEKMGAKLDA